MHITDLNECLWELPEISVLEYLPKRPLGNLYFWASQNAIDGEEAVVGPIVVDDRGVEYVVHSLSVTKSSEPEVCRVVRPNDTIQFENMTRSEDVPADLRRALIAFAVTEALKKVA